MEHLEGFVRSKFLLQDHPRVPYAILPAAEPEVRTGLFSVNHAHPVVVMFRE